MTADSAESPARSLAENVVVVGAGPAGLAAGWAIKRAGIDPLVIERGDGVAAAWRSPARPSASQYSPDVLAPAGSTYPAPLRVIPGPRRLRLLPGAVFRQPPGATPHRGQRARPDWSGLGTSAPRRPRGHRGARRDRDRTRCPARAADLARDGELSRPPHPCRAVQERRRPGWRGGTCRWTREFGRRSDQSPSPQRRGEALAIGTHRHEHRAAAGGRRSDAPGQPRGTVPAAAQPGNSLPCGSCNGWFSATSASWATRARRLVPSAVPPQMESRWPSTTASCAR